MISWMQVSERSRAPRILTPHYSPRLRGTVGSVYMFVGGVGGGEVGVCVCARTPCASSGVSLGGIRPGFKSCCLSLPSREGLGKQHNVLEPQFSHL